MGKKIKRIIRGMFPSGLKNKSSQKDFYRKILGSELNDMRDSINKMQVENGEEPYTEVELSLCDPDKDYGGYVYSEKALSKLEEFLKTNNYKD